MATSQNGWQASPSLKTRTIEPVKGVKLRIVDNQDVADIFMYLIQQFHKRVDDITKPHPADDWGFSFRPNRNSPNMLSNHSSGTAVDLDATEHPNGVPTKRGFTNEQISEIHKILRELEGTVRWGGDYTHTVDAMHFEIVEGPHKLKAVADKVRGKGHLPPAKKSITDIAKEVIAGKWGVGLDREKKLNAAGYDYTKVQTEVSRLLK